MYPQTNGKIERMNGSVKQEALRPGQPCSFQEAWEILNRYSYEYNHQRLHAGINFLRPADMFFGRGSMVSLRAQGEGRKCPLGKKNSQPGRADEISTLNFCVKLPARKKLDSLSRSAFQ
jgi:hypothetical protein